MCHEVEARSVAIEAGRELLDLLGCGENGDSGALCAACSNSGAKFDSRH